MQAPVQGGGAVETAGSTGAGGAVSPEIAAVLQQLMTLLSQLTGALGAQTGAAQAGAAPASAALVAGGGGIAPAAAPAAAAQPVIQPYTSGAATSLVSAMLPGDAMTGVVISGGGANAAPAAPAPAPAAAAAPATTTPAFDSRRLLGTPQPGGVISTILQRMQPTAAPAMSDGQFIVLTDGNGAQMQAHVHGRWLQQPDSILSGIQQGLIHVHLHGDGTVHLHDVA